MEIQCHSNPEIAARPCWGRVFQTEPVTKTRLHVAAEHRGRGADHDDFSLRASSHAGIWLDRRRHVRRTAAEMVSGQLSAQTHAPEHDVRKNKTTQTHALKQEDNRWQLVAVFVIFFFFFFPKGATFTCFPLLLKGAVRQC